MYYVYECDNVWACVYECSYLLIGVHDDDQRSLVLNPTLIEIDAAWESRPDKPGKMGGNMGLNRI